MTDEHRPVRLVLDTTAIVGFVRGAVSVGELLAEIDAEHGTAVVPLPCLVEAADFVCGLRIEPAPAHHGLRAALLQRSIVEIGIRPGREYLT